MAAVAVRRCCPRGGALGGWRFAGVAAPGEPPRRRRRLLLTADSRASSSSSPSPSSAVIPVERTLMPAGIFSRGFALLLDGAVCGGAAVATGEWALAAGHADGLAPSIAVFGGLMMVRDLVPSALLGPYSSLGKHRMGLELVGSDRGVEGERYDRSSEVFLITALSCAPLDEPVGAAQRLARNAHWGLLVPLSLGGIVAPHHLLPAVFVGGFAAEGALVLATRRSLGDFLSGTSLVWHDPLASQQKALAKADAEGGREERAAAAWNQKVQYQRSLRRMEEVESVRGS